MTDLSMPRGATEDTPLDIADGVAASLRGTSPAMLGGTPKRRLYDGHSVARADTIADLRAMAHRRLPAFALDYLEGGAEEEATLARNRAALADFRIVPRALVDVSRRSPDTRLLGRPTALPFAIAPTGLNALFRADADMMLAEAAAEAGIPFVQSTMSNVAMERIASIAGLRHWWQLYVFGSPEVRDALVDRAERAGCEALVVTIDCQVYGNREWARRSFTRPGHLTWGAIADAARHWRWLSTTVLREGMPRFENVIDFVPQDHRGFFDSAFWIRGHMDTAMTWDTLATIRRRWPRKLLVKGILHPEDVQRAAEAGADGVVLSNHGGRQLDWTVSGLDVLPEARRRVGRDFCLIVDGGIRRGTDVIKALCLGADAVFVGRTTLYGVAAGARPGVARAIAILKEEIDRDMGLMGVTSVEDLGPGRLAR